MLMIYSQSKYCNSFSAGTSYRRQILTYKDVPALKGLMAIAVAYSVRDRGSSSFLGKCTSKMCLLFHIGHCVTLVTRRSR